MTKVSMASKDKQLFARVCREIQSKRAMKDELSNCGSCLLMLRVAGDAVHIIVGIVAFMIDCKFSSRKEFH